jgi:hypothetical protein
MTMANSNSGKFVWALALLLGGILISSPVIAMEQGSGGNKTMKGPMPEMGNGQIMLGQDVEQGVRAIFQLVPLEPGSKSDATHYLMVKLTDLSSRKTITTGDVTVRVISPEEKTAHSEKTTHITQYVVPIQLDLPEGEQGTPPGKMGGMSGHFGTDVDLDSAGIWHFVVVAKLADGVERTFDAHYKVK